MTRDHLQSERDRKLQEFLEWSAGDLCGNPNGYDQGRTMSAMQSLNLKKKKTNSNVCFSFVSLSKMVIL